MAIVKESVTSQRGSGNDRTVSVVVSSTDEVLIAVVTSQDSNTSNLGVASIIRNSQNFTQIAEYGGSGGSGAQARIGIWYLTSPTVGTADAVADFQALINESTLTVYVLSGADAADLINGYDGDTGNGAPPAMSITTDVDNCFIIGGIVTEQGITGTGSGQTTDASHLDQSYENTVVTSEAGGVAGAQAHSYSIVSGADYAQMAVAINPEASATTPSVTTSVATSVVDTSALGNGNVTDDGGATITERGFCWGTSENPTTSGNKVVVSGTTGEFTGSMTGLTPSTQYHYRAYATNSQGTSYGNDTTFTTSATATENEYNITIADVDRTGDIINQSIVIEDTLNDKANTCNFKLIDLSGSGAPATDDEIIITGADGNVVFGGYIIGVKLQKLSIGTVEYAVNCIDYTYILDRNLAHVAYEDQTDAEIIAELINTYCPGFDISMTNVIEGVTINSIKFNYIQLSQALRRIATLTGRNWYIDYEKDIHYFPLTTDPAPFDIDSTNNDYKNLQISKDASQLKNRVYVRGGTKLSDPTTYSKKGDGVARQFTLPDKPHDVTLTVNGVAKSLGIKNIDTEGYDWYLNFQEKYVEQDSGGVVLATTDTLAVTYTYDIPILVAVEDTASILANGVKEFAIFDKSINTTQAARDRASAELTDYANDVIEGSFVTYEAGFRSGQYININLSEYGINDDYIVQKVVARSMGAGNFMYTVSIASSKTMGIIKFLISLLEANKNLIELDDDEVVDELLGIQDSLLADSLTESLTIDSSGAYFTWCTDSLQSTPITRARWDLFQWG